MKHTLAVFALLAGCSSGGDGKAPSIAALTYSPMTVPAGVQTTVSGSFTFTDEDGDADQLGIDVTLPDNSTQSLPKSDLQNVGDMTSGTIAFSVFITPPTAGSYKFAIFITDEGDNTSNKLMGTLTAN
jgi:hypothetical protein